MSNQSRRDILLGSGAAVAYAATGFSSAQSSPAAYLSLVHDDGYDDDYTITFQVAQDFGVPICVGPIHRNWGNGGSLSISQVDEIVNSGGEVIGNGMEHRLLGSITPSQDVTAGDTRIHFNDAQLLGFIVGDPVVITDDTGTKETVTIVGKQDPDWIDLESPVQNSYTTADSVRIQYGSEMIHQEVGQSLVEYEKYGWDVNYWTLAFNRRRQTSLEIISKYYTGICNFQSSGSGKMNTPINPLEMGRSHYDDNQKTDSELKSWLDDLAANYEYGKLAAHTSSDYTEQRAQDVMQWAQDRDIEIVTVDNALQTLDVVDSPSITVESTTSPPGCSAADNGSSSSSSERSCEGIRGRVSCFLDDLFEDDN